MKITGMLLAAALALGCGGASDGGTQVQPGSGGNAAGGTAEGGGVKEPETSEERDARRLQEAQELGCQGLCERATECAAESARESLSPEEAAEVTKPEVLAKNTEECLTSCKASDMSVRQVEVLHQCLDAESSCEQLFSCLEQAKAQ